MAHHHQLTAHSLLTTLSPGQIHYIQPSTSALPSATPHYNDTRTQPQRYFLRAGGGPGVTNYCLTCLQPTLPGIALRGGRKPVEFFAKACELLEVSFDEIQHEWDFVQSKNTLFCSACTEILQGLITLHEQIAVIQKRLSEGVDNVRRIIQETNDKVPVIDTKTINFRLKALQNGNSRCNTASFHRPSSITQGSSTDLSYLLNPPVLNTNQHDVSIREQPQCVIPTPSHSRTFTSAWSSRNSDNCPFPHSSFSLPSDCESNAFQNVNPSGGQDNYNNNSEEGQEYFSDADDTQSNSDIGSDNDEDDNTEDEDISHSKSAPRSAIPRKRLKLTSKSKKSKSTGTSRQSIEYFSPVHTDEQGRLIFEGIVIKPAPGESGYICGHCGAKCGKGHDTISMRKVKIHIKGVHLGAYKCDICDKKFTSNDIMSQHKVRSHEMGKLPCDICQRPVHPTQMSSHKFTHMNADEKQEYIAAGFKPPRSSRFFPRRFECRICKKSFKKRPVLLQHEKTHLDVEMRKNYKCTLCDRAYTSSKTLNDHIMSVHENATNVRKLMCKICQKVMPASSLKRHLRTHVPKEERPFVCKICGTRFAAATSLQKHEATHAPNETPEVYEAECDICGKLFKTLKSMKSHRKKSHRNHWKSAVPSKMINEVSIDKPDENGYLEDLNNEDLQQVEGSLYSYQLYQVKRLSQPSQGYRCCTCLKEFIGEGDSVEEELKAHIRTEHIGNFRCNMCTKRMKNIEEMHAHKLKEHMDCSVLDCEVCKKPGIRLKVYKRHLWLHKSHFDAADAINAGETLPPNYINNHPAILEEFGVHLNFHCVICNATFDKIDNLDKHRITQHPDAPKLRVRRRTSERKRGPQAMNPERPSAECPHCGQWFHLGRNMNRHLKNMHGKTQDIANTKKRKAVNASKRPSVMENEIEESDSDSEGQNCNQSDPETEASRCASSMTLRDRPRFRRKIIIYALEDDESALQSNTTRNEYNFNVESVVKEECTDTEADKDDEETTSCAKL